MSTALPTPVPVIAPETAPFWEATSEGRLLVQRCPSCSTAIHYPRFVCPQCHAHELEWIEAAGTGTIYSFTLTTRGILDYKDCGPYVLALVELDEGPRMMTNIVEADPGELSIGQRVEVVFHDNGAGQALPRFRPVTG